MVETAQCEGMVEVEAARYEQTLPTPSPSIRPVKTAGTQRVKQNVFICFSLDNLLTSNAINLNLHSINRTFI